VPVHSAGDTDGLPFYTMPYVEGESLRARLERGTLPVAEVIDILRIAGGYIVMIRLVRVDSGVELASFRETGDGPRGLIDAADKVARALRGKAGESLRAVNATPPLAQATTASLDALRKYSEATRAPKRVWMSGALRSRVTLWQSTRRSGPRGICWAF